MGVVAAVHELWWKARRSLLTSMKAAAREEIGRLSMSSATGKVQSWSSDFEMTRTWIWIIALVDWFWLGIGLIGGVLVFLDSDIASIVASCMLTESVALIES
ncbi:hypothetical protein Ddye_016617 [Dipteronia dyeriana]|uniref:Uncharacterized protein n=1 Tax=Dipteronia dyeriana TaxID=168575 RepID=A0AAD9X085_9ROSI|nr:hypothetical protein Ddye_016617 [Dipteronia dyeriana]